MSDASLPIAPQIYPAKTLYRGTVTDPVIWRHFRPRRGDVILATPSKSGTTWVQSIIAMLLAGGPDLPAPLTKLSPWIDANFFNLDDLLKSIDALPGRRVIKTHTPVQGFAGWEGVKVVSVFRHPLEVAMSLRKHLINFKGIEDHPMVRELPLALRYFLETPADPNDIDRDTLAAIVERYRQAVHSHRGDEILTLHYSQMQRDHAGAVAALNEFTGAGCDAPTCAAIVKATEFVAMKANASHFAPEAGRDAWHDEEAFFFRGSAGAGLHDFSDRDIAAYEIRLAELLPNPAQRHWLNTGIGNTKGEP